MIFALRKYSALWTITKNASEATPAVNECPRLRIVTAVLEIRLPTTGIKPATNTKQVKAVLNGSETPAIGKMANRYNAVNHWLRKQSSVFLLCRVNDMRFQHDANHNADNDIHIDFLPP